MSSRRAILCPAMKVLFQCAECGRVPRDDENPDDEWRVGSDGVGELHVVCPECWEREFRGSEARSR